MEKFICEPIYPVYLVHHSTYPKYPMNCLSHVQGEGTFWWGTNKCKQMCNHWHECQSPFLAYFLLWQDSTGSPWSQQWWMLNFRCSIPDLLCHFCTFWKAMQKLNDLAESLIIICLSSMYYINLSSSIHIQGLFLIWRMQPVRLLNILWQLTLHQPPQDHPTCLSCA